MSDALNTIPNSQPRQAPFHVRSETEAAPQMSSFMTANDFLASSSNAPRDLRKEREEEYASPPSLSSTRLPLQAHHTSTTNESRAASHAPVLPVSDFGTFKVISQDGGIESPSRARHIPRQDENDNPLIRYEEKNRSIGAASAAKFTMLREQEEREKSRRMMMRGGSESALDKMATAPTTSIGIVRAVIATASTGAKGAAVTPSLAPSLGKKPDTSYIALGDKEEEARVPPLQDHKMTGRSKSWSDLLLTALPGAPDDRKAQEVNTDIAPTKTGLTSFSDMSTTASSTQLPTSSSTPNLRRLLPRRSTNPFLNETLMSKLPKTPPLSPSSPFHRISDRTNPFARLNAQDDDDSDDNFHDALDREEYGQVPHTSAVSKNPFYDSLHQKELPSSHSPSSGGMRY
ncbi:hypothetical protein CBS101457_005180 [Exobasidium rhododendri]|nr:hypothetical protein CBS101457_005180 [Exobasidium rhododendri]